MTPAPRPDDPAAAYAARAAAHAAAQADAARRVRRLGWARLAAAVALAAGAWAASDAPRLPRAAAAALGAVGVALFAALVRAHRRARDRERAAAARHAAAEAGAARVRRDWAALPVPLWGADARSAEGAPWPPLADDLHLFGRTSLAQLLDVVTPALGGPRVAAWLLADPPPARVLAARQAAVRALAARPLLLEDGAALALAARTVPPRAVARLLAWAGGPAEPRAAALRAAAWAGPLLTLAALGAGLAGAAPVGAALAVAAAVNVAASALAQRPLKALLGPAAGLAPLVGPLGELVARVDAEGLDRPAWGDVQARLRRAGGAAAGLRRLGRWVAWAEVRYSPMLHWALAATVAWDAAVVAGLEAWRRTSGAAARDWCDALADAEAMLALATLAHDNPAWTFPEPAADAAAPDAAPALDADGLAHPLLPAPGRVGNAVRLGGPGSVLVVSGSNMAGKTTLLRAVGLNVLLAQAGGPACAARLRWRPLRVRTSVRVHDALDAGVSLFLAELRRIRDVVSAAEAPPPAPPVLYLFDEVLHGTNSADRRAATQAVLARLTALGAVGVVTTHDVEVASAPGLAPAAAHRHFREGYAAGPDGPRMTFDYVARPGPATTANALALLALLGLGPPGERPPGERPPDG